MLKSPGETNTASAGQRRLVNVKMDTDVLQVKAAAVKMAPFGVYEGKQHQ